jgi:anthranilate phosphoribosyltransferase
MGDADEAGPGGRLGEPRRIEPRAVDEVEQATSRTTTRTGIVPAGRQNPSTYTRPMDWSQVLGRAAAGGDLDREEARAAMGEIMAGAATPAQIAAFIVALRIKGETVEEMTGLVEAMRAAAVHVEVGEPVVDVVGTGGDRLGTFNISTTAALVTAGAGIRVAKHGNRSASSQCGSADVLEGLGVAIDLTPASTVSLIRETGFGFFFAPLYHPAMRHAGPVRRELGIPTVFNFLGPLSNPAGATRQAIGVSDPRMAERMIGVLARLGSEYAFVYHGEDGLDEVTPAGPTYIYRLVHGEVTHAEFTPEDFGVSRATLADIRGGTVAENVAITRAVLAGRPGPRRDATLINAAPAIVAAGRAGGFLEAMEVARDSIDSGAAAAVLGRVVERSAELKAHEQAASDPR